MTVLCPANELRLDSTGVILSPGYPDSYPNLQMCAWSISVEKGYNISMFVEFFQTEKEFDVLQVYDGNRCYIYWIFINSAQILYWLYTQTFGIKNCLYDFILYIFLECHQICLYTIWKWCFTYCFTNCRFFSYEIKLCRMNILYRVLNYCQWGRSFVEQFCHI